MIAAQIQEVSGRFPGTVENAWVISSETCALNTIGADFVREIKPGELLVFDEKGLQMRSFTGCKPGKSAPLSTSILPVLTVKSTESAFIRFEKNWDVSYAGRPLLKRIWSLVFRIQVWPRRLAMLSNADFPMNWE